MDTTTEPLAKQKLRLAIAMRGGVSLAVWIGGALTEIDALQNARETRGFLDRVLDITRFESVEIDVLTGASAGGLNAAVAAMSIAHGAPFNLRNVWLEVADIDKLLDHASPPPPGSAHRRSVLNGDYFLEHVTRLMHTASEAADSPPHRRVEAFLATTVFGGVMTTNPLDLRYTDRRSEAHFHFRHLGDNPAFSDFCHPDAADVTTRAARASASFPAAFEPVPVTLSSVEGRLSLVAQPPADTGELAFYDGGIVDNIPVTPRDPRRRQRTFRQPGSSLGALPASQPDREVRGGRRQREPADAVTYGQGSRRRGGPGDAARRSRRAE